jgi:AAA family ATP:ADP antiporter
LSGRVTAVLRRVVGRVVAVGDGEIAALFASCAYGFCLFSGYYILRPLREEMGVAGGVRNLPWMYTGTLIATLVLSPPFAALVSRFSRRRFIPYAYRFFTLNILIFFALFETLEGAARVGVARAFYIWVSVFNLFVVSVFWGFMADVFTSEQGKRLFGFIAAGGTLGAVAGSGLTAALVGWVGTIPLLLVSAALGEGSVLAFHAVDRMPLARGEPRAAPVAAATAGAPHGGGADAGGRLNRTGIWGGLTLVLRSRYLLGIVLYMLLFTCTSTFAYFEQARIVAAFSSSPEARTGIFARIDLLVNIVTLVVQAFLTGRVIRAIGVGPTQSILPLLSLAGFAVLAIQPSLAVIMTFQVLRRSADYAAAKPAREVLYTVLDREEKYKAKSFIDTFVYRGGDAVAGWVYAAVTAGGDPATRVVLAAVPITALWVMVCLRLGRRQQELAAARLAPV